MTFNTGYGATTPYPSQLDSNTVITVADAKLIDRLKKLFGNTTNNCGYQSKSAINVLKYNCHANLNQTMENLTMPSPQSSPLNEAAVYFDVDPDNNVITGINTSQLPAGVTWEEDSSGNLNLTVNTGAETKKYDVLTLCAPEGMPIHSFNILSVNIISDDYLKSGAQGTGREWPTPVFCEKNEGQSSVAIYLSNVSDPTSYHKFTVFYYSVDPHGVGHFNIWDPRIMDRNG